MDNRYEQETDLKDLLFHILYRWRPILLAAAALGVLMLGYRLLRNATEAPAEGGGTKAQREYGIALAEYELAKSTYERDIADCQARQAQQEAYMEKSVLMQVDPYAKPTASADIFVKLDGAEWGILPDNVNLDPTDSLLRLYTSNFLSTVDWGPVEQLTGREALYLKELLAVGTDYNSNTFSVGVVYSDGPMAQQILDIIVGQVAARYQGMEADVNRHTISIVNQSLSYTIDTALANTQKRNADTLAGYVQDILRCRKGLEGLEEPTPPGRGLAKHAALGFMAGGSLAAAFYGMAYLLGGRVHTDGELAGRYGWRLLGAMPQHGTKKPLPGIDRLLRELEGTAAQPTAEGAYRLIAANIASLAGGDRNLLVTGTVGIKKLQELTGAVAPLLEGITLEAAEDMGLSADTLKKLAKCDAAILVEERDASLAGRVHREQECLSALGKPVVGYILL